MRRGVTVYHHVDDNGEHAGGIVRGDGFTVPLRGGEHTEGADVEDLLDAARQRLSHVRDGLNKNTKRAKAYATAIKHLEGALAALEEEDA